MQSQYPVLVIPAYQPEARLVALVDELLASPCRAVLVVDDGSALASAPVFEALAQRDRVTVLRHAVNLGKGAALKTAFNHALVHFPDLLGVVTLDADGQHLPADVRAVGDALVANPAALVLGARSFAGKDVPLRSGFGNMLTGWIFRLLIGQKLRDTQTGLRGISPALMRDLMTLPTSRYEFELDMLITAATAHIAVVEVPIATVYEEGNRSSHFNPLRDSFRIYFVFLRFIFTSMVVYCIDLLVFSVAWTATGNMFGSVVSGRLVGLVAALVGSRNFVFKSEKGFAELAMKFFALWLLLLVVSYGLMLLFVQSWGLNVYLSRITVDTLLFLSNFLIQRDFIYAERDGVAESRAGRP